MAVSHTTPVSDKWQAIYHSVIKSHLDSYFEAIGRADEEYREAIANGTSESEARKARSRAIRAAYREHENEEVWAAEANRLYGGILGRIKAWMASI